MFYSGDEDEEHEFKRLFIDTNVELGCKVASITDEYISIKDERKKLIDNLLLYVPKKSKNNVKNILSDIETTYNQQSSMEFDYVLGILFDKINMLPELTSVQSLRNTAKKKQN